MPLGQNNNPSNRGGGRRKDGQLKQHPHSTHRAAAGVSSEMARSRPFIVRLKVKCVLA